MSIKQEIMAKIQNKTLSMAVCGLGYVGLPLAVDMAKHGFKTIGFDVQLERVNFINAGKNYIGDVVDADLQELVAGGMLRATADFSIISQVDFIAICVPTPLDTQQQPDISHVSSSGDAIAKYLKKGAMVVLESTTYPGTTEELLKPILEQGSGLKCGEDFYLGFSPERVDPGNPIYKTGNTPKVVGAIGADATEVISLVYRAILDGDVHTVSSPAVAEMEKLLENTYRNINIGLVNELAILCNKMNINIWEVIDAAKTKPYGFQAFYPGPGAGGHCIPLDPCYLSWKANAFGFHTSMIETSMRINNRMPAYIVERSDKILRRHSKVLNESKILVLGVAYKQDIDDCRESPAIHVISQFQKAGAQVDFYDPYIAKYVEKNQWFDGLKQINTEILKGYDLICITTAHTKVDYNMVARAGVPVFDCKNATKNIENKVNIEVL